MSTFKKNRLNSWRVIAVIFVAMFAFSGGQAQLDAQDDAAQPAAAENPTPENANEKQNANENPTPENAPENQPANEQNPTPPPANQTTADFLTLERAARQKTPELFEKLTDVREFTKRLPNFWRSVKLTKKQTNSIYAIQKDYFDEISKLEARIKRLEDERDAKMRAVLTEKQRAALDAKIADDEKKRADRAAAKEAEEEARAEAEIAE